MRRLALVAAAGIALAGCGGGSAVTRTPRPQYPVVVHSPRVDSNKPPHSFRVDSSAQLVSPTRLAIVTTGSSSCPSVPDELVVLSRHAIRIHLTVGSRTAEGFVAHPPPSGICTADFGTTSMLVAIDPTAIDVYRPLTVRFLYHDSKKPLVRIAAPLPS